VASADPCRPVQTYLSTSNILAANEQSGLLRPDRKRPDELALIPSVNDTCVTWHVTATDTLTQSYQAWA